MCEFYKIVQFKEFLYQIKIKEFEVELDFVWKTRHNST